jgi:hypothetical protein
METAVSPFSVLRSTEFPAVNGAVAFSLNFPVGHVSQLKLPGPSAGQANLSTYVSLKLTASADQPVEAVAAHKLSTVIPNTTDLKE